VILRPITFGTATPGLVVVPTVVDVEVEVEAAVVVVVSAASWAVGELLHDERADAAPRATAPAAVSRPRAFMRPSWSVSTSGRIGRPGHPGHFKMLTARATTRIPTTREMADSAINMSLAQPLTADTSVGLKAVAVANAKWK